MFTTEDVARARAELVDKTAAYFAADPGVVGVFVAGSLAAGTATPYSDIDLRVVCRPDDHARLVGTRLEAPLQWGAWLFNEWHLGATHCVSHFAPFNKIDVFYVNRDDLEPSAWLGLPVMVCFDPEGIVADVVRRSADIDFVPSQGDVERSIGKALATLHEATRRVCVGQLVYAASMLDSLRFHLVLADDWLHGRAPVGLAHCESRISDSLSATLTASCTSLDRAALCRAIRLVAAEYRAQIEALHDSFSLQRSPATDEQAVSAALELLPDEGAY